MDQAVKVLSKIDDDSTATEKAQRDTLLGWMLQRQGDHAAATAYFQRALAHPIHEVHRRAITQLSTTSTPQLG
jgi:Tfp pilus assembly protein PilF